MGVPSPNGSRHATVGHVPGAERTNLARATLAKLRVLGGGPPFVKLGAKVLYDADDLDAWIAAKGKRRSTTAAPAPDAPRAA
ncbi:MAG: DNA-binding protein [Gemmatimonadales bacterium]|nr:DNA-binding protein [Gemmatimonadales bacterium]